MQTPFSLNNYSCCHTVWRVFAFYPPKYPTGRNHNTSFFLSLHLVNTFHRGFKTTQCIHMIQQDVLLPILSM